MVSGLVHDIPVASLAPQVCDQINSMIWTFYPWGWTIASLTAINLVDGTQDYTPTNTDILRPLKVRVVRTDVSPNEYRELALLANLSPELTRKGGLETLEAVGWFTSQNFFRLNVCASVGSGQTLQLQGEYQKIPTKITAANMTTTTLPIPDHYFDVFCSGILWKLYKLADDPRAGGIQMAKNGGLQRIYTGQLGEYVDALLNMSRTEDLGNGDEFQWPESPLGVGRSYWPGVYGL